MSRWRPELTHWVRFTLAAAIALGAVPLFAGEAQALSCGSLTRYFAGTIENHSNTKGGSAKIEYINGSLCTGGAPAFNSYWASVVGSGSALNIYQVGVDECRDDACPGGVPENSPYYFWAYGRQGSTGCGVAVDPIPHYAGVPGSGSVTYTVMREKAPSGSYFYFARISGVTKDSRPESNLSGCWSNGVTGVQLLNETYGQGTQVGGPDSNHQNWETPLWFNGSSWQTIVRSSGSICDDPPSLSSQGCQWANDGSGRWWTWDERF